MGNTLGGLCWFLICWFDAESVCPKFSKKKRERWKEGEAYSQTPEARLRQPEPRRDRARALAPSQSKRFVNKPSRSL